MIDYEVEYNNRARVPEHPQIFARWREAAAAYREHMKAEENAEEVAQRIRDAHERGPFAHRKRQDIGRPVDLAMFAIDAAHHAVVAEQER